MENQYKEEFREIFQQHVTRRGGEQLLDWLENTDFFSAPASTKFHCACEFGLVRHSLNVYHVLREKYFDEGDSEESFALCGLLHDVCKAQFYKVSTRNVKNDATGQWEKQPFYTVEDAFPLRPRGKIRVFDRTVCAPQARRGHGHPLAYGRV